MGSKSTPAAPPPPNYAPMQAASDHAADLGYKLGSEQLAESKRQYELNRGVSDKVSGSQIALMDQAKQQGDDYYNYMVRNQRPVEEELNRQSMAPDLAGQAASRDQIMAMINANAGQDVSGRAGLLGYSQNAAAQDAIDRGLITGGNQGVYNARQGDIEWGVGNAAADARNAQAQQANMMLRQGLRYGYSPAKLAAMAGQMAGANSSQVAGASNMARSQGIDQARQLMGTGYDMRQATDQRLLSALGQDYSLRNQTAANQIAGLTNQRNMGIQDQATNWGRQMDVAGLYRGLAGASQGAYGLANSAGNSAMGNTMQPGNALMTGMAQGAGMQQQGVGQQIGGLGSILGAQGQYNSSLMNYNAQQNQGGGLGALLGAGSTLGAAEMKSGGWGGLLSMGAAAS